ncbi:uncharacterized protein LOC113452133 [Pseudonaja textilis]|nr:uncharacterized protein LOC113452102 [Pseudonaja textilis]XP_026579315.1 uncharacterized protein LOC113452112 [Pseudonaja textilis]XP_026579332.1 uncharacterized protein LOC113452124 [Pseudonaja textilis]XP_026579344.1 uncharacterized protein LOC113452133 [Pseudonaja textilis]
MRPARSAAAAAPGRPPAGDRHPAQTGPLSAGRRPGGEPRAREGGRGRGRRDRPALCHRRHRKRRSYPRQGAARIPRRSLFRPDRPHRKGAPVGRLRRSAPSVSAAVGGRPRFRRRPAAAAAAAAALTQGLERIPEQTGYLVICDGAVLASAGDLENDERTAGAMAELVSTACAFRLPRGPELPFRRLSVVFGEHSLLATVSGQKLFVVKRLNSVPEPVVV